MDIKKFLKKAGLIFLMLVSAFVLMEIVFSFSIWIYQYGYDFIFEDDFFITYVWDFVALIISSTIYFLCLRKYKKL